MNREILKKCQEELQELKKNHPEIDIQSIEESLNEAMKNEEDTFFRLTKEDAEIVFDRLIDEYEVDVLSDDIKTMYFEEVYLDLEHFTMENWSDTVESAMIDTFKNMKYEYLCQNFDLALKGKWLKYEEILSKNENIKKSWYIYQKEDLDAAVFTCVKTYLEHGLSEELDTELEDVREYERDGIISIDEYQQIIDLWFEK